MSPHCSATFLQHSRSADVIAAPGNTHAATGSAASISARAETPTLIASLTPISLVLTIDRGNGSRKVSNGLLDLVSIDEFATNLQLVTSQSKKNLKEGPEAISKSGGSIGSRPTRRNNVLYCSFCAAALAMLSCKASSASASLACSSASRANFLQLLA